MTGGRVAPRAGILRRGAIATALPLVVFLYVVPMQLDLGGAHFNASLVVMATLAGCYFADQWLARRPLGREHRLLGLMVVLLTWFLAVSVAGGARDFLAVQMCVYGIIMYAGALMLVRWFRRRQGEQAQDALLKTLFALGLVHAAVQFLVLVSPAASDVVYRFVGLSDESAAHISQRYRSPGLFSSGAAILGTFNAWILVIGWVAWLRDPGRTTASRILALALATLFEIAAIAISGRTGFVALTICLGVLAACALVWDRRARLGRRIGLVLACSAGLVAIAALSISTEAIEQNLRWSFEFLYSLSEGRGLSTDSTTVLMQMLFLPDGWLPLLLGTSNFGRSPDFMYVNSDIGYVLMLYGGGVVGMLLMLSVFGLMAGEALRSRACGAGILVLAFVATLLVVNFKDFYFIQNSGVSQLLMLCFAALVTAPERGLPVPQASRARRDAASVLQARAPGAVPTR